MSIDKIDSVIDITDIMRHMEDIAARIESKSLAQKRYHSLQQLLTKIQSLSDKEFETAFASLESLVESYNTHKKNKSPEDKTIKKNTSDFINKKQSIAS